MLEREHDGTMAPRATVSQANIYAVLTILATIFILPITFALEPPAVIKATVDAALGSGAAVGPDAVRARRCRAGASSEARTVGSQPLDSPPPQGGKVGGWGGSLCPTRRVAASYARLRLAVY